MFSRFNRSIKRNACFLCTTPLQILGAISLQLSNKQDADLFLFDDYKGYQSVGERLEPYGIFNNVYLINFYSSLTVKGIILRLWLFLRMIFCKQYLNFFLPSNIYYDKLYTSSSALSKMVIANALKKRNNDMRTIMYDDGVGSYSKTNRVQTGSSLFRKAKTILGWKDLFGDISETYLYQPTLFNNGSASAKQLPFLELNDENKNMLLDVFGVDSIDKLIINEKAILFDTYRGQSSQNMDITDLDSLYSVILQCVGKQNIILKEHPRSTGKPNIEMTKFPQNSLPIELVFLHQKDLENKVLIALNSTAVFTPKMLFNKEPRIILLYRLIGNTPETVKKRDELYLNMLKMYSARTRVFIPETKDQLIDILDKWMSE